MKDIHPSAIHPRVPYELLERSCFPGDNVLDPMAGSGMTGVACEKLRSSLQLNYTLIDKEPNFISLMKKNLLKGYDRITDPTNLRTEVKELSDFRETKPGSPEWIKIWTEHPDKRDEMMTYSESLKAG
jgi:DNA modification methylase